MSITSAILNCRSHRPFALSSRSWKYYQEWADTLFLHWKMPADVVQELLPSGLVVDTLDDTAWVSVVAFTVKDMRVKYLPPFPYVSDFHEVNLRTYVVRNGIPGIYFITIEASKLLTALMAKGFIGLDYKKAKLKRRTGQYSLKKSVEENLVDAKYLTLSTIQDKTETDKWLTERYCAYEMINGAMYRFNIHHKAWPLKKMKLRSLKVQYHFNRLSISNAKPDLLHFSHQQKVLLWGREKC